MAGNIINVTADFKETTRYLTRIERKQLPFATALTLTRTAAWVAGTKPYTNKGVMQRVMPRIFDRPSPWVSGGGKRGGFFIVPAKKTNLESQVRIKDEFFGKVTLPAWEVLKPHIFGRPRALNKTEKLLRSWGWLGPDEVTIPGKTMRKNKFGNLAPKQYSKILADVQGPGLGFAQGRGLSTTTRGRKRFFYDPNLRPRGIYERTSRRGLRVALLFIKAPSYRRRFDFYGISERAAIKRLPREFRMAMAKALATARR